MELRTDATEASLPDLTEETGRLRDRVIPASVARADALLDRIAEELEETGSLVERSLRNEPLPVAPPARSTRRGSQMPWPRYSLVCWRSFAVSEEDIQHRLDRYLDDLRASEPVLDLGCGRGELLLMLREAGIAATGVEGDGALAEAAHRRGSESDRR